MQEHRLRSYPTINLSRVQVLPSIHAGFSSNTARLFELLYIFTMAGHNSAQYLGSLFGLQGKTALITGGTRGIGAGLTVAL